MRALLLTVTAGQGHNVCATAMQEALEEKGVECVLLDTMKYINEFAGSLVDKSYATMSKLTPAVWGRIYNSAVTQSKRGTQLVFPNMFSQKLYDYIDAYRPDVIVCTHFAASLMISALRKRNKCEALVIGINTDFTLHPFWEDVSQDYIVLACEQMDYMAQKRGIDRRTILPWGIPVRQKFKQPKDKQEMRKKLGLADKQTLCVMSGSMGFGEVQQDVEELDNMDVDFQMIVVCGSNKKLHVNLSQGIQNGLFRKNVLLYGYADNVEEIMAASDVVCTKPGGLSTSETLSIGRPLVLLNPIPGVEELNAWFLVNNNLALHTGKSYSLCEAVYHLIDDSFRKQSMLEAQARVCPKEAANRLSDFIVDQIQPLNLK